MSSALIPTRPVSDTYPWSVLDPALSVLREFHNTFQHPMTTIPSFPSTEQENLRMDLIEEEFNEVKEALACRDLPKVADGLYDLLYVTLGALLVFGLPAKGFDEVHWSNMTKLGADGKPIFREDGKSLKGPNFVEPALAEILTKAGWKENKF